MYTSFKHLITLLIPFTGERQASPTGAAFHCNQRILQKSKEKFISRLKFKTIAAKRLL